MESISTLSNLPAILLTALIIGAIVVDVRLDPRKLVSGRNVVLAGILAWYMLECVMLPEGLQAAYDQGQYNLGLVCVACAAGSFLLAYHAGPGCPAFVPMAAQVNLLEDRKLLWRVILVGAAVGFAPILYYSGGQILDLFQGILGMRKTWGGVLGRGRYGDMRAAILMLEMFAIGVAPFAAILLFDRHTPLLKRLVCAVVVVWPLVRAYGNATRSSLVLAVVPVLAVLYFKASPRLQRLFIVGVMLSAPVVYGFMAAVVASRGSGEFSWEAGQQTDYVGNEMFRELLFIKEKVPDTADYQYGYSYYVQLVNPIPRFLWPGKPVLDSGILMARLYDAFDEQSGDVFLTVSPGLIGEMYLNFGWVGVIALSAFGGWLVRGWDRIASKYHGSVVTMVFFSGGLATLFVMGRSFTMSMFYGLLAFSLLAWLIAACGGLKPGDPLPGLARSPTAPDAPRVTGKPDERE